MNQLDSETKIVEICCKLSEIYYFEVEHSKLNQLDSETKIVEICCKLSEIYYFEVEHSKLNQLDSETKIVEICYKLSEIYYFEVEHSEVNKPNFVDFWVYVIHFPINCQPYNDRLSLCLQWSYIFVEIDTVN